MTPTIELVTADGYYLGLSSRGFSYQPDLDPAARTLRELIARLPSRREQRSSPGIANQLNAAIDAELCCLWQAGYRPSELVKASGMSNAAMRIRRHRLSIGDLKV